MSTKNNILSLTKLIRSWILKSTTAAGSGHPTSSLPATNLMIGLMLGGGFVLLSPLPVLALEGTTQNIIQWFAGIIVIIVLLIAFYQVIPTIIVLSHLTKLNKSPEAQRSDQQKEELSKLTKSKRQRIKIIIICVSIAIILFLANLFYVYVIYPPVNSCDKKAGWEATPCTNDHNSASLSIIQELKGNLPNEKMDILSWDTKNGRIYYAGWITPYGYDCVYSDVELVNATGVYYNSHGEKIAECLGMDQNDPEICSWLRYRKPSQADFTLNKCTNTNHYNK
jgi:hypothetical protein